jgi:hypothetical protein
MEGQGLLNGLNPVSQNPEKSTRLAGAGRLRQHLLDFDRNPVAIDEHDAAGDGQGIGENFDFVSLGRVEFDNGAATQAHDLMNRHRRGPKNHHEVDADFIESWHWESDPY